jgi:hypothetical protein
MRILNNVFSCIYFGSYFNKKEEEEERYRLFTWSYSPLAIFKIKNMFLILKRLDTVSSISTESYEAILIWSYMTWGILKSPWLPCPYLSTSSSRRVYFHNLPKGNWSWNFELLPTADRSSAVPGPRWGSGREKVSTGNLACQNCELEQRAYKYSLLDARLETTRSRACFPL